MFDFWKPKTPEIFLSNKVSKLEDLPDHKKLRFLEKHLIAIRRAMENDPFPVNEQNEDVPETMEWTLGYLYWHGKVFDSLHDEDDMTLNTRILSPAAEYFYEETKADAIAAFHALFQIDPVSAIGHLAPAMLFKHEIAGAMESLAHHDNPKLYFDCFDVIDYSDDVTDTAALSQRLIHATSEALANLLGRQPATFLAPINKKHAFSTQLETYLSYLPEGVHRQRFIMDNMDTIDTAVRGIAVRAHDNYFEGINDLCYAFTDDMRPAQLTAVKNLLLSERVKLCFEVAAIGARHALTSLVDVLDGEPTDLAAVYSHYADESFVPAYELLRLTNPSASATTDDKDAGADSKYLWMVKKADSVIAASFAKATVSAYLKSQAEYVTASLPTVSRWEGFMYEPSSGLK